MGNKEAYLNILKGLKDQGFLTDDAKYGIMQAEILKMNDEQLKKLKRAYKKLKAEKIQSKEDYKRFMEYVLLTSSSRFGSS